MENSKVIRFVVIMTVIVALGLTGLREITKSSAEINEAVFKKRNLLKALGTELPTSVDDMTDQDVIKIFDENVEQKVVNYEGEELEGEGILAEKVDVEKEDKKPLEERKFPLFIYTGDGGSKYYILPLVGNGLWDKIFGNIALREDLMTLAGASFDHKGETPGLGAEIKDNPNFSKQFTDKTIMSAYNGEYTSVVVRKGGAKNKAYEVDGISGATVTADGVTEMLKRGIAYYEPYLGEIRVEIKDKGAYPTGSSGE